MTIQRDYVLETTRDHERLAEACRDYIRIHSNTYAFHLHIYLVCATPRYRRIMSMHFGLVIKRFLQFQTLAICNFEIMQHNIATNMMCIISFD